MHYILLSKFAHLIKELDRLLSDFFIIQDSRRHPSYLNVAFVNTRKLDLNDLLISKSIVPNTV